MIYLSLELSIRFFIKTSCNFFSTCYNVFLLAGTKMYHKFQEVKQTMRDCEKILDQKLGSREFAEAFEATSMEYDFIDRIAAACAKLSKAEKGEN